MSQEISVQEIQRYIYRLPNRPPFMMSQDLARIYETEPKYINRAIKRNKKRFPEDFCFQLSKEEVEILRCQSGTTISKMSRTTPYGFTREGANMLSAVLHTEVAIDRSLQIMRAFSELERQVNEASKEVSEMLKNLVRQLEKAQENSEKALEEARISSRQITTLSQEVYKISERANVLENQVEAVMKTKGSFNEKHWLFGKLVETVAEGIDQNREEIRIVRGQLEKLTKTQAETLSKKQKKNSKTEKK
ncbi:MAG: ORF6N domain-containing protein [Planctomycetota bacterium]